MEWEDYENRVAVKVLHKVGESPCKHFSDFEKLKISWIFVYWSIQLFIQTGSVKDRPRECRSQALGASVALKRVAAHIRQNPEQNQSMMARELNMSQKSMSRLLSEDLGLRAYRRHTGHFLTLWLKKLRELKCRLLPQHYVQNGQRSMPLHWWKNFHNWEF